MLGRPMAAKAMEAKAEKGARGILKIKNPLVQKWIEQLCNVADSAELGEYVGAVVVGNAVDMGQMSVDNIVARKVLGKDILGDEEFMAEYMQWRAEREQAFAAQAEAERLAAEQAQQVEQTTAA